MIWNVTIFTENLCNVKNAEKVYEATLKCKAKQVVGKTSSTTETS